MKRFARLFTLLLGALLCAWLTGCVTTNTAAGKGSGSAKGGTDAGDGPGPGQCMDCIRIGDRLAIAYYDVSGAPGPSVQQVRQDGRITLIHNVEFTVVNKTRAEVEREIIETYTKTKNMYQTFGVTVQFEGRTITVGGEVRNPGAFNHPGDMTIIKAINMAGGFTEFAKKTQVRVTRATNHKQLIVDCKKAVDDPAKNIVIFPGDEIFVTRRTITD